MNCLQIHYFGGGYVAGQYLTEPQKTVISVRVAEQMKGITRQGQGSIRKISGSNSALISTPRKRTWPKLSWCQLVTVL